MTSVTKINPDIDASHDLVFIKSEIAELMSSLSALAHKAKLDVSEEFISARDAAEHFGDEVSQAYKDLAKRGRRSAKAIGQYVEDKPAISLFIGLTVLFGGRRILSR